MSDPREGETAPMQPMPDSGNWWSADPWQDRLQAPGPAQGGGYGPGEAGPEQTAPMYGAWQQPEATQAQPSTQPFGPPPVNPNGPAGPMDQPAGPVYGGYPDPAGYGPAYYGGPPQQQPPKSNAGRNAAIVGGAVAAAATLVVALVLTTSHGSNASAGPSGDNSTVAVSSASDSAGAVSDTGTATSTATSISTVTATDEDTDTADPDDTTTADDGGALDSFDPSEMDKASTDPAPFTTDALLPQDFTDGKQVDYSLQAGGKEGCIHDSMSSDVQSVLKKYGCTKEMTGSYTVDSSTVDSSSDILVSVQIFAFDDEATAEAVYGKFPHDGSWDFGIWCPKSGYGAHPCSSGADYKDAYRSDWLAQDHRYVIEATALYTNLSQDSSVGAWTSAAAKEAVDSAGPTYYISLQD